MDKTACIRDKIFRYLKRSCAFKSVLMAEVKHGTHFSATDLALTDCFDRLAVYRLILIKHEA